MLHHSSPKLKAAGMAGLLIGAGTLGAGLGKLACDKASSTASEPATTLARQHTRNTVMSTTRADLPSRLSLKQPVESRPALEKSNNPKSGPVASEPETSEEQSPGLEELASEGFPGKIIQDGAPGLFPLLTDLADLIFPPPPSGPAITKPSSQSATKELAPGQPDHSQLPPFAPPGLESLTFDYPPMEWREELDGQAIVSAERFSPPADSELWNYPKQLIDQRFQAYSRLRVVLSAEALEALFQEAWSDETMPEELKAKILIDVLNDRGAQIEQPDQSPSVLYLLECQRAPQFCLDTAELSELLRDAPLEEFMNLYRENSGDTAQACGRRLFIIKKMTGLLLNGGTQSPAPLTEEVRQEAQNFLLAVGFEDPDSGVQYQAASLMTQFSTGNGEELGRLIFRRLDSEEIQARGFNPVVYARFRQQAKALLYGIASGS